MGRWPLILVGTLLCLIPSVARSQPAPPRDPAHPSAPPPTGTASIAGRVVSLDTGTPLRHVQLILTGDKLPRGGRIALTDAQGQYELKKLPAGRYSLTATKGGYVMLTYGQRGPRDPGHPIDLADRQALDKIDIALPRGAVITGRVVDEAGEPVTDQSISALTYQTVGGKRRLVPVGTNRAPTNDIGQYRLFGLPPGEYYVSASGSGSRDWSMVDEDGEGGNMSGYLPTFYPGTPIVAEAQRVTVGVGQEAIADIQLVPTKVSRVSGTLVMSNGKTPRMGMIVLRPHSEDDSMGAIGGGHGGQVREDGTFIVTAVPPGPYQLIALASDNERPEPAEEFETVIVPVTVNGDVADLHLTTSKGISLSGHVILEGATPENGSFQGIVPTCRPLEPEGMFRTGGKSVDAQGQFQIGGLQLPCIVAAYGNRSNGWLLKSVTLNGEDITDTPVEPNGKPITGVEITMTMRRTTLTGSVHDARDQPVTDCVVVAFADDRERWKPWLDSRYIKTARPDQAGTFQLEGLPPAAYRLVALEHVEQGEDQDPDFLARIQPLGTRVELSDGGTQSVSLKVSVAP